MNTSLYLILCYNRIHRNPVLLYFILYRPFTGYHSPGLTVDKTAVIPDANNSNFSTLVTCVKGVPGNHKICLQTSSDGTRQG